jgi:hypothetical protein
MIRSGRRRLRAGPAAFARSDKHNLIFLIDRADAIASARQSVWVKSNLDF